MAADTAHRKFYDFEEFDSLSSATSLKEDTEETESLFNYVNENIIGNQRGFSSPFGYKKVTYCDYIASGRSLKFIEQFILDEVLPQYGSTHTTTSVSSLQTTLFRHEARDIIRNAVRASEHDRIIFTGSGSTGAINKLINGLNLEFSPIVFIDFTAHHSSLLPWREIGAMVIRIKERKDGSLDKEHLESLLIQYKSLDRQMIGCFTAASNITGLLVDTDSVTSLLHKYGAFAFWDFATAAPYVDIIMNPVLSSDSSLSHKDAIFFSLHKFVGGVQTPGVLIAKKSLFRNSVPEECGGGTVFFVSRENHRYLKDVEEREEGGTPPIVETIRGGMVMQLKMNLTPKAIKEKCLQLSRKIEDFVSTTPEIVPLGNMSFKSRLPILSFLVKHPPSGKFLHYNFISALLNDVYGVQSRGGCACAGPYGQDLLGIDESLAQRYEKILLENQSLDRSHLRRKEEHGNLEVLRPGFVRINIPFTASDEQVNFIFKSVKEVCKNGWKLLPQYIFNPETGEWKHHTNLVFKSRQWLQNISYSKGVFDPNLKSESCVLPSFDKMLEDGEIVFEEAVKIGLRMKVPDQSVLFEEEAEKLRWFLLPFEAQKYLKSKDEVKTNFKIPFTPLKYPLDDDVLKERPDFLWSGNELNKQISFSKLKIFSKNEITKNSVHNDLNFNNEIEITKDFNKIGIKNEKLNNESTLNKCVNGACFVQRKGEDDLKESIGIIQAKTLWVSPPKIIFNPTVEAIESFSMIQSDDKVLVCLSGGKDSLSLLHTLRQYQFYSRSKGFSFSLGAVTVDPLSTSYDPRPLIPYLKSLGVPYFYEEQDILKQAMEMKSLNSICSFCSRLKRGRIYAAARKGGYNVLAMGQHLDDLAESFLMSVFHNGRLRTMKASYTVKEGDLRVIRPFIYVREKELRHFAESKKLPIIPENCPGCFESPKERHRVKQLLAQQEVLFPGLFWSLKRALVPLFSIEKTGLENSLFGKNCFANPMRQALQNGEDVDDDEENEEI